MMNTPSLRGLPATVELPSMTPLHAVVADANAVLEDVVEYALRGFSRMTMLMRLGAARVYVPEHVPAKVEAGLEEVAGHRGVPLSAAREVWENVHRPVLIAVALPEIIELDDPRVHAVLAADPEDAPVAQLAVLLAPALLLTKDHHLLDADLGVAKWADALGLVEQIVAVDAMAYSTTQMAALAILLGCVGARAAARAVAASPVLLGLVIATGVLCVTEWRPVVGERLGASRDAMKRAGSNALALAGDAAEHRTSAQQRLQALAVRPATTTAVTTAARTLATSRAPLPLDLLVPGFAAADVERALSGHPAFVIESAGLALGRPITPRPRSG
jgi:hypothetical protein